MVPVLNRTRKMLQRNSSLALHAEWHGPRRSHQSAPGAHASSSTHLRKAATIGRFSIRSGTISE
jgi:hypothetical protein